MPNARDPGRPRVHVATPGRRCGGLPSAINAPVVSTLLGLSALSGRPSAGLRHGGDARRGLGQPGRSGRRSAHRHGHAYGRPFHRQPFPVRPPGEAPARGHRPRRDRQARSHLPADGRRRPLRPGGLDSGADRAGPPRLAGTRSNPGASNILWRSTARAPFLRRRSSAPCTRSRTARACWSATSVSTRCGWRSTTSSDGFEQLLHLRRPGHHGLLAPGGPWRARPATPPSPSGSSSGTAASR